MRVAWTSGRGVTYLRCREQREGVTLHELGKALPVDALCDDGIHPSAEGYKQLGRAVAKLLLELR